MTPLQMKALRDRLGLTQQAFCDAYGLNVKTYRDWEGGVREPKDAAMLWLMVIDLHRAAADKVMAACRRRSKDG